MRSPRFSGPSPGRVAAVTSSPGCVRTTICPENGAPSPVRLLDARRARAAQARCATAVPRASSTGPSTSLDAELIAPPRCTHVPSPPAVRLRPWRPVAAGPRRSPAMSGSRPPSWSPTASARARARACCCRPATRRAGLYAALRDHAADGSLPSDHVTVLGLDEYLGLGAMTRAASMRTWIASLRVSPSPTPNSPAFRWPPRRARRRCSRSGRRGRALRGRARRRAGRPRGPRPGSRRARRVQRARLVSGDGVHRVALPSIDDRCGGGRLRRRRACAARGADGWAAHAARRARAPAHRDRRGEGRGAA